MDETERADERYRDLETRSGTQILDALLDGQRRALEAVNAVLPALDAAVQVAAERIAASSSSRLAYCGAGTSGRIGLLDAVELGPTFDWPDHRRLVLLAGGADSLMLAREGAEDESAAGRDAITSHDIGPADVLVALAASGRTPFTLAAVEAARERGTLTIAFANNPDTPLLRAAHHGILLRTGPEVLAGSTRLAAGTAQKIALNLFSTALMTALGKVFRGRMVDMRPSNEKLRRRALAIVREVTGCDEKAAKAAIGRCGTVREAILSLEAAPLGARES